MRYSTPLLATVVAALAISPALAEQVYYGSRAGMTATVLSKTGIGTENAVIQVEHTPEDAKGFCVEYNLDNSMACVRRTLAEVKVEPTVYANCKTMMWTDLGGERYAILGRRTSDTYADFDVRRISSGEILDGSSASGYPTAMAMFNALCPGIAD
ncbi:MAG TPA: hypothetical protein VIL88_02580 [Devosia sp.]|jgi:hypothetical protein|uniref:hypothetical protein n=1 Tax=Devosia sp. TaxID=1871048 RepID=UPI002F94E99C